MKAHRNWSYTPYRPPFFDAGDIYICRVTAEERSIHAEWIGTGSDECGIFIRRRGDGDFLCAGITADASFTVKGLEKNAEYEFFVESGARRSRVRLAKCGAHEGIAVNYLHPEDEAYSFSGRYLCSPSLLRHPDGYLLASMDLYGSGMPQNLTLIFRSDDEGQSWHYVSELFPCFWGKMFICRDVLYMIACSTEYGDLLIGRSDDGGRTFCEPAVLLRGGGGKNGEAGIHKNPQPVAEFGGRIWNTCEWGSWKNEYRHAAMVMSAPADSDLMCPDNWTFSEPVIHDDQCNGGLTQGKSAGVLEGCLAEKDGRLYNIMRYQMAAMTPNFGYAISYSVNTEDPEAPLTFRKCIPFPANHSKFEIKFDPQTRKYYSVATRIYDASLPSARNLLSLMASDDLEHWETVRDIYDHRAEDPKLTGFQYVDFLIEGNEILFLCRTAQNGAHSFHDSNYSVFDRIVLE